MRSQSIGMRPCIMLNDEKDWNCDLLSAWSLQFSVFYILTGYSYD